jgi:SAM-dependent methyltransferase
MSDVARPHFTADQRLAFGRVADLYEQLRPSYPAAAIDAVLQYGELDPGARIVDVGAGTGKATELFAARGLHVVALEPSAEMARVARGKLAGHPHVEIVESEFERWTTDEPFAAIVCAAAWHWIDPDVRYAAAHGALAPGGTLAAIWSLPDWALCPQRDALRRAYRTAGVTLPADFPMHPDSEPTFLAGDWDAETAASGHFGHAHCRTFPWSREYPTEDYLALLQTHQDHILLDDGDRARLLHAVRRSIEDSGGIVTLPLVTHVCLARRVHSA